MLAANKSLSSLSTQSQRALQEELDRLSAKLNALERNVAERMATAVAPRSAVGLDIAMVLALLGAGLVIADRTTTRQTQVGSTTSRPEEPGRGRHAATPEAIPAKGLRDVFWRVVAEVSKDRVTLVAAGVTYYLLLALFPALAALVSLYGLIADPCEIGGHLASIAGFLPSGSFTMISDQLKSLTEQKTTSLSIGFFGGLGIALWSAHSGTMALFDAMNIAYEEREKRGIIQLNLVALCFTIGTLIVTIMLITAVAIVPVVLSFLWLDRWTEFLTLALRWPVLLILVLAAVTVIYRFAPSRAPAKIRWVTWGAVFTTVAWFVMSLGFSFYLDHFANYNATYGTLGTLIGFMVWTWISVAILIVGAELNAELEHQTAEDTTTGPPQPMGLRGAYVADTVGEAID